MTSECKILFPDLPPYNVVVAPTVPGIPAYTIMVDGYKEVFIEYAPFPPALRFVDCDAIPNVTSREWKPGVVVKPQPTEVVLYSNCEDFEAFPETWKHSALRSGEFIFDVSVRVQEVTRILNPYPGVPCKYEYTLKMEVFA